MYHQEMWVREQLRKLDEERRARLPLHLQAQVAQRPGERGALGGLARRTGRLLRRAGEGLEAWAAPSDADIPSARRLPSRERVR